MSTLSERFNRSGASSSSFNGDDDSDDDLDMDDDKSYSVSNSSSNYSCMNSSTYSSSFSLNERRRSRNQNEKKRRDQFNMLIQELGTLLNHPKKIDKSTVLSETLYFFRNFNEKPLYNKDIDFKWKPFFLQNDEFMRFMIEFQNAFCLVFDLNGQIKYVSDDIISLLGHYPKNVQNLSLYDFIDEKSVKTIKNALKKKLMPLDPISFDCWFKKGSKESAIFELVNIKGFFKKSVNPDSNESYGHFNTFVKLDSFTKIKEIYPTDNMKKEFSSEFSNDFKYTSLDSKATEIIGYSSIEILGNCGYDYIHHDDLEKFIDCHKKLIQIGAAPSIGYRFRTKGYQWIWLQTRFELLPQRSNAIIAHNQVISLNEMLTTNDIIDNSARISRNANTMLNDDSLSSSSCKYKNQDNNKKVYSTFESFSVDSKTYFDNEELKNNNKKFRLDNDQVINQEMIMSPSVSSSSLLNSNVSPTSNINSSNRTIFSSNSPGADFDKFFDNELKQNSYSTNIKQNIKSDDYKLDDTLGTIFMKSYNDLSYRTYVLNQFKVKKAKIESIITKHQEELKILEETMENIKDDKKLASWVMEFQRQEKMNQTLANNKQNLIVDNNNINTNNNRLNQSNELKNKSSSSSPYQSSAYSTDINNNNKHNNNRNNQNDMNKSNFTENISDSISNDSIKFNGSSSIIIDTFDDIKTGNGMNKTMNEISLANLLKNDNKIDLNAQQSNDESNLIKDLMYLRNLIPNSLNLPNNNNIQQTNYDIENEINPEMVDKLFNSYSYDPFQPT